jgi:hypothetical protein
MYIIRVRDGLEDGVFQEFSYIVSVPIGMSSFLNYINYHCAEVALYVD